MPEFISAVGGGVNWLLSLVPGALGTAAVTLLMRPKALLQLMVAITVPFSSSQTRRKYLEALSVVNGGELPPEADPSKKKNKKGKKRGK
jgi:hypothetical protein